MVSTDQRARTFLVPVYVTRVLCTKANCPSLRRICSTQEACTLQPPCHAPSNAETLHLSHPSVPCVIQSECHAPCSPPALHVGRLVVSGTWRVGCGVCSMCSVWSPFKQISGGRMAETALCTGCCGPFVSTLCGGLGTAVPLSGAAVPCTPLSLVAYSLLCLVCTLGGLRGGGGGSVPGHHRG